MRAIPPLVQGKSRPWVEIAGRSAAGAAQRCPWMEATCSPGAGIVEIHPWMENLFILDGVHRELVHGWNLAAYPGCGG